MYQITANNDKGEVPRIKVESKELNLDVVDIALFKNCAIITTRDNTYRMEYGEESMPADAQAIRMDKRTGRKLAYLDTSPHFAKKIAKFKKLLKEEPNGN